MTETEHAYFGQNGTISVVRDGETTPLSLAIVQNWKANIEFETSDLYGMGSVWRKGAARYNAKITVSCEFCAIPDSLSTSIIGYVIDPITGTPDTESTNADSTRLARFKFTGVFVAEDGTHKKTIEVGDVYFSNFPWEASTGEWIKVNMEGTGSTYKITDGTV